jgi:hypothetical protein
LLNVWDENFSASDRCLSGMAVPGVISFFTFMSKKSGDGLALLALSCPILDAIFF